MDDFAWTFTLPCEDMGMHCCFWPPPSVSLSSAESSIRETLCSYSEPLDTTLAEEHSAAPD